MQITRNSTTATGSGAWSSGTVFIDPSRRPAGNEACAGHRHGPRRRGPLLQPRVPALRAGGRSWGRAGGASPLLRAGLSGGRRLGAAAAGRRPGAGRSCGRRHGVLFGAVGAGAVAGALLLGRVQAHLATNGTLALGGGLYAAALAAVVVLPGFPAALASLLVAGLAWMTVTSTQQAELQLVLPAWVRARGGTLGGCQLLSVRRPSPRCWWTAPATSGPGRAPRRGGVSLRAGVDAGRAGRCGRATWVRPARLAVYTGS